MTITLSVVNFDSLPDGGSVFYRAIRRGFLIGRDESADWRLPDPSRKVSSRHCEIRFDSGAYWLFDQSTNGVFLNGARVRIAGPYRLASGDRLGIGDYVIEAVIDTEGATRQDSAVTPAATSNADGDVWTGSKPSGGTGEDAPTSRGTGRSEPGSFSLGGGQIPISPLRDSSTPPQRPAAPDGSNAPQASGVANKSDYPGRDAPSTQSTGRADLTFIERFCAGAGIDPAVFSQRDPGELAQEIGEFVRLSVENITELLKARATAKTMTRSSTHTIIGAADNNPLKYVPSAAEAIGVMFAARRAGYLGAQRSVTDAFADLRRHETATYVAMQKALARLLDGLAPEDLAGEGGSSIFSSSKSRAWDAYVERWDKLNAGENGMLDAYMGYFAEAYDQASKKK